MVGMKSSTLTFAQRYLAAKISALDDLLSGRPRHPSDFINAWSAAMTAFSVAFPSKSRPAIGEELRACFPCLNTRWHS